MEPIPLFRNLMRQASVLYDDVARSYLTRYIKLRFRVNKDLSDHSRICKLLREGRRGLSVLTRANSGDPKPLQRVLEMGYGRVGRRKHELLRVGQTRFRIVSSSSIQLLKYPLERVL